MKKLGIFTLSLAIAFVVCGMAYADDDTICAQVITYGQNPETSEWLTFPTPCEVPAEWETATVLPEEYEEEPFYCVPDFDGDGMVNKRDLTLKKKGAKREFDTWKKDCWKAEADCGDYDSNGAVNAKDRKAKKADRDKGTREWQDKCWLPSMTAQNETEDISETAKVSVCGGFDDADEAETADGKRGISEERLSWKYNKSKKLLTLVNENVWLNCCGERSVSASFNEATGIYEIYETDKAEMDGDTSLRCRCECFFDFKIKLPEITSDSITVKIFRVISDSEKPMSAVWKGDLNPGEGSGDILIGKRSGFVSAPSDGGMKYDTLDGAEIGAGDDAGNEAAREIEEADIIRIDGTYLYILNRYRGLFVCNISDPDNPVITGRAPVSGSPVDMYIRDNMAYILVSDMNQPVYRLMGGNTAPGETGSGSRVDAVDISNKTQPRVSGTFNIEGMVTDSRIVGKILYVVSSEQSNYYFIDGPMIMEDTADDVAPENQKPERSIFIASIDLSNPASIQEVDREDFEGSAEYIHVTEEAIFISSGNGYYWDTRESTITYVDISDPNGAISKRGDINVKGRIEDKFKMDFYNGYFRVCTYQWEESGLSNLFVIDTSDPDNMRQVSSVELAKGEQLFATRFDGDRAYMVTYERKDPLWVIDLSDPVNPEIKGELIVPGWSTHIEPRGDRLIALGVDDTDGWKVAVSLFNVSDPENPSLIKRVSFGEENGWSSSTAYGDVKAFTVLDDMNLILLPYTFSDYSSGNYRSESRLQLIDYSDTDLTVRGWISQKGSVLRSRSFEDRLFSVSDDELQVIDASNRDKPLVTAKLQLVLNIADFLPLNNGYGIQVVSESDGSRVFRSVPLSDPESETASGEIVLEDAGSYSGIIANGNLVYVISNHYDYYEDDEEKEDVIRPDRNYARVRVLDFSNVSSPRIRGSIDVPGNYYNLIKDGAVISPYSSGSGIIQVKDDVLAFPMVDYYRPVYYYEDEDIVFEEEGERPADEDVKPQIFGTVRIVSLADPDSPELASELTVDVPGSKAYFAKDGVLYFSYEETIENDDRDRAQVQYFLSRVDLSDPPKPAVLAPVNIPGTCVAISDDGTYIYTLDSEWGAGDDYSQTYSFNVAKLEDDTVLLTDKVEVDNYFGNIIIADGLAYLSGYRYWWYAPESSLTIVDLADPENLAVYKNDLPAGGFNVIGAKNQKVFATTSGGVACYDSSNPAQLEFEDFRNGWYSQIVFSETTAYLPMGYYGLWMKGL